MSVPRLAKVLPNGARTHWTAARPVKPNPRCPLGPTPRPRSPDTPPVDVPPATVRCPCLHRHTTSSVTAADLARIHLASRVVHSLPPWPWTRRRSCWAVHECVGFGANSTINSPVRVSTQQELGPTTGFPCSNGLAEEPAALRPCKEALPGNRVGRSRRGVASARAESSRFASPLLSLRSFG